MSSRSIELFDAIERQQPEVGVNALAEEASTRDRP
jgi:hypothetical protein